MSTTYRIIFALTAMLITGNVWGATYYFSQAGDNSAGDGSLANPWKSHPWMRGQASNPTYTPAAGDEGILRCGDEWYTEIRALQSGTSNSNRISITSDCVSFHKTGPSDPLPVVSMTYDPTSLVPWANTSGTIYTTAGVTASPVIVAYHSASGAKGVLKQNTANPTTPGTNEWGYTSSTLYINVGENPTTGSIYASKEYGYSRAVTINSQDYLTVSKITVQCAHDTAIGNVVDDGTGNVFDQMTIRWFNKSGFYLAAPGSSVTNNTIYNTYGYQGGAASPYPAGIAGLAADQVITGNDISNVGGGYYGGTPTPGGSGIYLTSGSATSQIIGNVIDGCYAGIEQASISSGSDGNIIALNLVRNSTVNAIDIEGDNNTGFTYVLSNTVAFSPSSLNSPPYKGHGIACQVACRKIKIANNNVYIAPIGSVQDSQGIFLSGPITEAWLDYNNYHIAVPGNGSIGYITGANYRTTLAAWQADVQASAVVFNLDGNPSQGEAHSTAANPSFATADYRPRPDSPLLGAGTDLYLVIGTTGADGLPIANTDGSWPVGAWGIMYKKRVF